MEMPAGYSTALSAMAHHVNSARPDAPVRPDPPRRSPAEVTTRLRAGAAAGLHAIANRLEPRRAPVDTCVTG
ncbi:MULTISPECIES: hypothetical protein [unclassified Solwaraspora]|uniref:hypothetical protein n=1 Tax=unclassified Solwaraspora TaxID=2627926 RepID=UPI00259B48F5|nr:hypothetical protein [Solwaraspora sp. WMMA2056]WJK38736.1 hypothetical protein O7608_19790 [Solwaraspora sp. WMMA2056]